MDPLIVLFGFGVGLLVATTGMGGGSLMTPLLILVFAVKPVVAIGTDLIYGAVTKTLGGWRHFRRGSVHMGTVMWLAVGSVPGAIIGVLALNKLESAYGGKSFDNLVLVLVAGALIVSAAAVLIRELLARRVIRHEEIELNRRDHVVAVATGLVIGFVLSVTSAGSGSLIAVVLILWFQMAPRRTVGTDVFHAAILLWVAGLAHLFDGNVNLGLAGNILVGSLPGVWIGTQYAHKLPETALRPILGIVMLASGLALLSKAGVTLSPYVVLGVPLATAVVGCAASRARTFVAADPTPTPEHS